MMASVEWLMAKRGGCCSTLGQRWMEHQLRFIALLFLTSRLEASTPEQHLPPSGFSLLRSRFQFFDYNRRENEVVKPLYQFQRRSRRVAVVFVDLLQRLGSNRHGSHSRRCHRSAR